MKVVLCLEIHSTGFFRQGPPQASVLVESIEESPILRGGSDGARTAVGEAAKMFGTPSLGDTIYVISEGGDNQSQAKMRGVLQALTGSGIRLFAAVLAEPLGIHSRSLEALNGPGSMKEAVRTTRGALLFDPEGPGSYNSSWIWSGRMVSRLSLAEDLNRQVQPAPQLSPTEDIVPGTDP